MDRRIATLGLLVGLAGLALQFAISVPASIATGRGLVASLVWFFSFFTILTNVGVVLAYSAALSGRPRWFAAPRMRAGLAVAISVVLIVYATVLARLWQPQGLFLLADVTLHYVSPVIYVIWWIGFGRSGSSRLGDVAWWMAYPLVYLGWVLARGAITAEYPYPFLDLNAKTGLEVAQSAFAMLCLFIAVSLVAVAADRFLPTHRPKRT